MVQEKKSFRFYWHLFISFLGRYWAIIVSLLILTLLVTFLDLKFDIFQKQTLRIGYVGQYDTSLPDQVSYLISQGLVAVDDEGNVTQAIAQEWQIDDEGKKYTFTLRDDLTWDDGHSLSAKDINYSYQDLSVEAVGNNTLIFNLQESYSPLLTLLSGPIFKKNFVGVGGDYKVKKTTYQGNYISQINLEPLDSDQPELEIKFYNNEDSLRNAFKLGEVDIVWGISDAGQLVYYPQVKIQTQVTDNQYNAIFFNLNNDLLGFKPLRQALAYATPKPQGKQRATGPISPNSWAYNDYVKTYDLDLDHAKQLLADNKDDLPEEIEITLSTLPGLLETAEKTKQSWESIGIKTNIQVVNFVPDDYQALLINQSIPQDPDQYWFWHSSQTQTNITHLANLRIDQLLEEGRQVIDTNERREKYVDFQRFLLEESPAIFISYPTYYYIYRHGFENASVPLYNR